MFFVILWFSVRVGCQCWCVWGWREKQKVDKKKANINLGGARSTCVCLRGVYKKWPDMNQKKKKNARIRKANQTNGDYAKGYKVE